MTTRALLAFIANEASPRSPHWREIGFIDPPVSRLTLAWRIARYLARRPSIILALVASLFHAPSADRDVHGSIGLGTLGRLWRWLKHRITRESNNDSATRRGGN